MGLFSRDLSPVRVTGLSKVEHIPAAILIVVPEFRQSIGSAGAARMPPSISAVRRPTSMLAPMALQAAMVAIVSAESRQSSTLDLPAAMAARKIALWVWLLEGGGETAPFTSPPLNMICVIVRTSSS